MLLKQPEVGSAKCTSALHKPGNLGTLKKLLSRTFLPFSTNPPNVEISFVGIWSYGRPLHTLSRRQSTLCVNTDVHIFIHVFDNQNVSIYNVCVNTDIFKLKYSTHIHMLSFNMLWGLSIQVDIMTFIIYKQMKSLVPK